MKTCIALLTHILLITAALADQTFNIPDIEASITSPDGWVKDTKDHFGVLIRPEIDSPKKIRFHMTSHKGIPAAEAIDRSAKKIGETRKKHNQPVEEVISSTPLITKSGIKGQKATVGQQGKNGPTYLNRYYFEMPDARIFCVCVYHLGNSEFSKLAENMIIDSLSLSKATEK